MKNTKINEALGMLDDDIITEALHGKKTRGNGTRRIAVIAIAATLAVSILAATLVFALGGIGEPGASILPPEGQTIIKFATSSAQIDGKTVYSASGDYYSVEGQYSEVDPESYYVVNGVEIEGKLYEALVGSNDPNRTWAVNVSLSPNLYMTEEYIQKEVLYWTSKLEAKDLEALAGILSQVTGVYDLQLIYEQYKDKYNIDELYKYFASGKLEEDLLNADVEAITKKVEELWDDCVKFKDDLWANMVQPARAALDALGIEYAEENGCFTVFVTESELISLQGVEGLKFSKAEDYDIGVGAIDPNSTVDWNGITVTRRLKKALEDHEDEDVLYAVLVKAADAVSVAPIDIYEAFSSQVRYLEITEDGGVVIYVNAGELDALTFEGEYVFNLAQ